MRTFCVVPSGSRWMCPNTAQWSLDPGGEKLMYSLQGQKLDQLLVQHIYLDFYQPKRKRLKGWDETGMWTLQDKIVQSKSFLFKKYREVQRFDQLFVQHVYLNFYQPKRKRLKGWDETGMWMLQDKIVQSKSFLFKKLRGTKIWSWAFHLPFAVREEPSVACAEASHRTERNNSLACLWESIW
jgi:hypothetical protein